MHQQGKGEVCTVWLPPPSNLELLPGQVLAGWAQMSLSLYKDCPCKEGVIGAFVEEPLHPSRGTNLQIFKEEGGMQAPTRYTSTMKVIFSHIISNCCVEKFKHFFVIVSAKVAPGNKCHLLEACWNHSWKYWRLWGKSLQKHAIGWVYEENHTYLAFNTHSYQE